MNDFFSKSDVSFDGSDTANAPTRRFFSLSMGGAPQLYARAGISGRCDGLVRDRALVF